MTCFLLFSRSGYYLRYTTLCMIQHNHIIYQKIWKAKITAKISHELLQHIRQALLSGINILCNKSGYREAVIESSSRGCWRNRILVHGATSLAQSRSLHHRLERLRWINISNPLGDQRLPVQKWPEFVCCHNKKETWSAGEFLTHSIYLEFIFYIERLGLAFTLWFEWSVCLQMVKLLKNFKAYTLNAKTETCNFFRNKVAIKLQCLLWSSLFDNRFEHPAGGYKKIFETCEELAEPLPSTVTGLFASLRQK